MPNRKIFISFVSVLCLVSIAWSSAIADTFDPTKAIVSARPYNVYPVNGWEFTITNNSGGTVTDFAVGTNYFNGYGITPEAPTHIGGGSIFRWFSPPYTNWYTGGITHVPWLDNLMNGYVRGIWTSFLSGYELPTGQSYRGFLGMTDPISAGFPVYAVRFSDGTTYESQVVPIPAAAWLLGSGLVGLVALRRRYQR